MKTLPQTSQMMFFIHKKRAFLVDPFSGSFQQILFQVVRQCLKIRKPKKKNMAMFCQNSTNMWKKITLGKLTWLAMVNLHVHSEIPLSNGPFLSQLSWFDPGVPHTNQAPPRLYINLDLLLHCLEKIHKTCSPNGVEKWWFPMVKSAKKNLKQTKVNEMNLTPPDSLREHQLTVTEGHQKWSIDVSSKLRGAHFFSATNLPNKNKTQT